MATEVSTAFEEGVQGFGSLSPLPAEPEQPLYRVGLHVDDCVPAFTDVDDDIDFGETAFAYQVVIDFATYDDMQSFLQHPQRGEIENSITQYIKNQNRETLELEMIRDLNPVYTETGEAGPESFNSGTLGDFQVSVDEIIPQMNAQYGINISSGFVAEQSVAVPGCIPNYIGPNEFAGLDAGDGGGLGAIGFDPTKRTQ